jgi:ribonuclease Z
MRIIGPHGLQSFWNSSSNFTYRPQFPVTLHEQAGLTVNNVDSLVFDKVLIHCLSIGSEHSHLCYVIETKSLPGKFDVVKAKALGVPKGPLFGQLQNGKNVILEDGKTITPEEVVGPSEKARYAIIICNCVQSDSLVLALVEHPFWQRSVVCARPPLTFLSVPDSTKTES